MLSSEIVTPTEDAAFSKSFPEGGFPFGQLASKAAIVASSVLSVVDAALGFDGSFRKRALEFAQSSHGTSSFFVHAHSM